ncbi:hypothetical protein ACFYO0_30800 [Streptomyces sp. NPDC006365]|uniref:hypothetical protein n=1 Tax=Streptomyces sp. NPDC006365 TaxID=3364744 RepID=UPI00368B7ACA
MAAGGSGCRQRCVGYTGSANLRVHYINSGRVEADHAALSPRRVTRLLTTRPDRLDDDQYAMLGQLTGVCPEMTALPPRSASSPACSPRPPATTCS